MPITALLLAALLASPAASAPLEEDGASRLETLTESRELMGTRVTVIVSGGGRARAERGVAAAFRELEAVEAEMSEWRPESALSRVNAAAGSGRFVAVPRALCEVLAASLEGARRSGGLFDPTWAALRGLWRFPAPPGAAPPDPAAIRERCALVAWEDVELERRGGRCRVRLRRPGMALGLGGVAKGFAVDRAVAALRAAGLRDFVVQAGGDLYAAGRRGGRPWRVGIRDPRGPEDVSFARIELSDAAFSTSGDYERFFESGGRRYHHLLDPRSCEPATATRSATILARTALEAELASKPVFILGGAEGLAAAARWGAEAVLVTADNEVLLSPSLVGRVVWRTPTP